jgi:CHAT domain-containing protein
LPGTRVEADSVAARFGGALLHLGAAATVQALKAVSRPALLHLGTHGFFEPQPQVRALRHERLLALGDGIMRLQHAVPSVADHPMLHAGLALAGANRCGAAALITAAELALLDLRGTELVLLSACETGLGTFAQGEEFAGLRRSLAIAGAARQFITLWSIDDDAGAAFVAALYRALADGQPGALALRTAQQALRGQPHWAHPFYWAAYAGWGDLAPLSPALRARASRS